MAGEMVTNSFTDKIFIMKLAISQEEFYKKRNEKEKELKKSPNKLTASYKDLTEFDNELNKCYKAYPKLEDIEKEENLWDTYDAKNFDAKQKESFKFYFCGYLQYYDEITRNNCIDHTLHFKWDEKKGQVHVYICPRPRKVHENPETCPPAGHSSDPIPPKAPPPPYP